MTMQARLLALLMLLAVAPAGLFAQSLPPLRLEQQATWRDLPRPPAPTQLLELRLVNLDGWPAAQLRAAVAQTAEILGQCGIGLVRADLFSVQVPDSHRHFDTPRSRELARALDLPRPVVFFAAGTRQVPAYDAEAIGRGNSRSRPELADSVWVARGARDLGIVLAHELAHVLMDSGEHDGTPGNLMGASTTPENTALNAAQCERLRRTGERHGLLRGVD